MRNLFLLLLGIAIGAAGGAITANTLNRRDAYPRGVMNVMQHHLAVLKRQLALNRCEAKTLSTEIASLHGLTADLETTFYPDATADPPFSEYAQRLRDALAATAAATDCSTLAPNLERVVVACDACHRQYR
jgi:hypothetical protein